MGEICSKCGGLIMKPGIAYGWGGPICNCLPNSPYLAPRPETNTIPAMEIIERMIKERDMLMQKLAIAIDTLQDIAYADYRGNRPSCAVNAFNTLKVLKEIEG